MRLALQHRSIAFRLIVAVLAVELVSSIAVIFLSLGYERHTHFVAFEIALRGRADSVLGAVQDAEDKEDNVMLNKADLHLPPDDVYEVSDQNGRLLGRSPNWQGLGPGPTASSDSRHGHFLHLSINGRQYHVLQAHGSRIVDPAEPGGGKLRQVTILYGAPTEHVWRAIHRAVEFYAAGSLVLLLVTGPLIAWLLHRGLLPLRQLAALAGEVSVDSWQFSPPASASLTPELAPLTHAIENVLKRLERSFAQQRTFVSDAAHELKTAVAVIKSSLQLLEMRQRTPQEYRAGLERCLADSLRLEELVAKMLTLARLEGAASETGPRQTSDLAVCLSVAVAQLETFAALHGIRVSVAAPASMMVPIAADDCTLLLSNLLLNALQHSPAESTVDVRLSGDSEGVELDIEDHGEGIDADILPQVFDRFYRGDPSRTRTTGGTGLGLAIAKAIVERAGGSIALSSQPGLGTTVTVRLPMAGEVQNSQPKPPSA
jgi:signal transduction histidine kinase